MMVSFVLSFFPRGVLDEILNLIESVSEGFPSYSCSLRLLCVSFMNVYESLCVFLPFWLRVVVGFGCIMIIGILFTSQSNTTAYIMIKFVAQKYRLIYTILNLQSGGNWFRNKSAL